MPTVGSMVCTLEDLSLLEKKFIDYILTHIVPEESKGCILFCSPTTHFDMRLSTHALTELLETAAPLKTEFVKSLDFLPNTSTHAGQG